jgi:hypothetical protein
MEDSSQPHEKPSYFRRNIHAYLLSQKKGKVKIDSARVIKEYNVNGG